MPKRIVTIQRPTDIQKGDRVTVSYHGQQITSEAVFSQGQMWVLGRLATNLHRDSIFQFVSATREVEVPPLPTESGTIILATVHEGLGGFELPMIRSGSLWITFSGDRKFYSSEIVDWTLAKVVAA